MQVVVTSFGSDGDFNPLLAIAAALRRRGADVTFVANPFYAARVAASGCRFVAAGRYFDLFAALEANREYMESPAGALRLWRELIAPSIRDIYPVALDCVRDVAATVLVSHLLSYGGAWAAAAAGVRSVVVTTTAPAWLSRHEPAMFANWRPPRFLHGYLMWVARGAGGLLARRPLGRLAAELGAPPVADIVRAADLNLGVWPDWYRRAAADDPPRSHACGFVFDHDGASQPLRHELADYCAAGAPPVVVGFGSAASLHGEERYRAVVAACRRLERRCLAIGASARGLATAGDGVMAVDAAPYAQVFPAAAAIVHHGGFGSSGEALRAGRPQLVTPFAFDQFDSAARIADLGCGHWFRGDPTDSGALAAELESTLGDASIDAAARQAAERIAAAADGAARAAELIEQL